MKYMLLLILAVTSGTVGQAMPSWPNQSDMIQQYNRIINAISTYINTPAPNPVTPLHPAFNEYEAMLKNQDPALKPMVINKVITALKCAHQHHVVHNNILTIIDYSLPSSEKRLWVFDMNSKKLLYNTYVSHGIKSGALYTTAFSNVNNSKSSSLGVYKTEQTYYGRDGLSLRLDGLERGFNSNAALRYIVMHGGWYVEEQFIKKYGRAGRSWGCPAVPLDMTKPIINTIKDHALFVVYYPSDEWFLKSRFLTCNSPSATQASMIPQINQPMVADENDKRDDIVFLDLHQNNRRDDSDPVVAMTADQYAETFHTKPPLNRMLRRQINHVEYIALNPAEMTQIAQSANQSQPDQNSLNKLYFIIPVIKMIRGYYETQMHPVNYGKVLAIKVNKPNQFVISFEKKSHVRLGTASHFIRWLGL